MRRCGGKGGEERRGEERREGQGIGRWDKQGRRRRVKEGGIKGSYNEIC